MQIEFTLTEDERLAVQRRFLASSPALRSARRRSHAIGMSLIALVMIGFFFSAAPQTRLGVLPFVVSLVLMLGFYAAVVAVLRRVAQAALLRRMLREGGPPKPTRLSLEQEGIRVWSADSEGLHRWTAVRHIERLPGLLVFWLTTNRVAPVPLRAFDSEAAADAFERDARASWEQSKSTPQAR